MQKYDWIGLREKDNFSYTKGESSIHESNCNNSIIISDLEKGVVKGIDNHALIKSNGKSFIIPINEIDNILRISNKLLKGEKIFYKKPNTIIERETLRILKEKEIKQKIFNNYRRTVKKINKINTRKGNNRVYRVVSEKRNKFILKYHGKKLELFNAKVSLLGGIPYFPRIISTVDSLPYIRFNDSIYALEEFAEGEKFPLDKEDYFKVVGKHLAFIHNELNQKKNVIDNLEEILSRKSNPTSESNLISMQIDLINNPHNEFFLKETASFPKDICGIVNSFPNQIIHGDLNKSNLIWKGNNPTTIDFEMISYSKRIKDFIPALLFEGNLNIPRYLPNSLRELTDSYGAYSKKKLTNEERNVIPDLLKFYLIKSYVIYVLRRNYKNKRFKNKIVSSLEILREETNVY